MALRRDKMHSRYRIRAFSPRHLSSVTPYHDAATEDSADSFGSPFSPQIPNIFLQLMWSFSHLMIALHKFVATITAQPVKIWNSNATSPMPSY